MSWNPLIKICVNTMEEETDEQDFETLQTLRDYINVSAETGSTALHFVGLGINTHLAYWLLANGATFVENEDAQTPLHWACKRGHLPMVSTFLECMTKEEINKKDFEGATALDWAKEYEHPEIIKAIEEIVGVNKSSKHQRRDKGTQLKLIVHRRISTITSSFWNKINM